MEWTGKESAMIFVGQTQFFASAFRRAAQPRRIASRCARESLRPFSLLTRPSTLFPPLSPLIAACKAPKRPVIFSSFSSIFKMLIRLLRLELYNII